MKTNNFFDLLHQGYRVALGAGASFVETLQDNQKRELALSELQIQLNQKVQEWSQKGEIAEQEARKLVDIWLQKRGQKPESSSPESRNYPNSKSDLESEIQELTEKIITLRTELQKTRGNNSSN